MKTTKSQRPKGLLVGLAATIGMQAGAYAASVPDVPDQIKAPAGEGLVFRAHASGTQIYVCQQGADGKSLWTLKAPEAQLHDGKGTVVGRHYAGPTWKHNDGSEVTGKASAKMDSPDPHSIPWLLLTATAHSGAGVFAQVTSIQRIHTKGGQAPAATSCDSSKLSTVAAVPYTADYYFYAPAKSHPRHSASSGPRTDTCRAECPLLSFRVTAVGKAICPSGVARGPSQPPKLTLLDVPWSRQQGFGQNARPDR